ncbi:hypothetical protein [Paenarthrobacter ilicis]|uniref:hypothetical protein n=1 Tax=Paenarthrobacter ilicis TaxID=43665 RepID=UPI0028D5B044|nr:hypothetical protein [Paenarthrobacter ilicis]
MSEDPYGDVPFPDEEPAPEDAGAGREAGPPGIAPAGVDGDGVLPSVEELVLDHDGQLGQLRADVDGLMGLVGDLFRKPPAEKPTPWNWKELDGPGKAALLTELRQWVDWYNGHYGVTADSRILGCWYRHGPVVEELIGVWIAWRAAYYGHKTPNDAPAYWHERILWPALARITKSNWGLSACIPTHKDPRPKSDPSTDDGFATFISALDG